MVRPRPHLEVVQGHMNQCVTFPIEYLGNRLRYSLGSKGPPIGNAPWESNGHMTPICLEPNISKTTGDPILLANYYIVCCVGEAVRLAILATAWLLVILVQTS